MDPKIIQDFDPYGLLGMRGMPSRRTSKTLDDTAEPEVEMSGQGVPATGVTGQGAIASVGPPLSPVPTFGPPDHWRLVTSSLNRFGDGVLGRPFSLGDHGKPKWSQNRANEIMWRDIQALWFVHLAPSRERGLLPCVLKNLRTSFLIEASVRPAPSRAPRSASQRFDNVVPMRLRKASSPSHLEEWHLEGRPPVVR